jgi:hypothetical protein
MASMHNNDPHLYINACQNGSIREDGGGHVVTHDQLQESSYVVLFGFGTHKMRVITSAHYMTIRNNDPFRFYRCFVVPCCANWFASELSSYGGLCKGIYTKALVYFSIRFFWRVREWELLSVEVDTTPTVIREDLIRYCIFYYLLEEDDRMISWTNANERDCGCIPEAFVYNLTLQYIQRQVEGDFCVSEPVGESDAFIDFVILPRLEAVYNWVRRDFGSNTEEALGNL